MQIRYIKPSRNIYIGVMYFSIIMLTTIQITSETLVRLKAIKLTSRESYNEIINRLIDIYLKAKSDEKA